jgi:AcrR family transcriptional regulator
VNRQQTGTPFAKSTTEIGAAAKRRRFFQAAEPLFSRFGYRKTTVENVCQAAGMSKKTFYELFSDKRELLLQLVEHVMNETTRKWESELSPDLDPLQKLHSLLDWYARAIREHPFFQVLVEDLELMGMFGERLDQIRITQMGGPFDRIVRDGIAAGQFRRVDPRAAMWIVLGLLDMVYLRILRIMNGPGALEDRVLSEEVRRFIVRGLGAIDPGGPSMPPERIRPWEPPVVKPGGDQPQE